MDTTTKIMLHIMDDLAFSEDNTLEAEYTRYYESLDPSQSKEVVSGAIRKILENGREKGHCEYGDTTFKLSI